jgi:hypothetical protein
MFNAATGGAGERKGHLHIEWVQIVTVGNIAAHG